MKTTTLLATQAYIVGGVMESVIKAITGRQRPNYEDPKGPQPYFHGPSFGLKQDCSFPSGHTTVAFAAATVFAMEYRDHPIVPVICYSAASLIGLSRITQNAHWISDVFAGAALGYVTGRQVVNNYHRYAWLKNHRSLKNKLSFSLQYNYNHFEPAIYVSLHK
jgi:membrane-associated phospholipid phosphatase